MVFLCVWKLGAVWVDPSFSEIPGASGKAALGLAWGRASLVHLAVPA